MLAVEIIFWLSLALVGYAYIVYPMLIAALAVRHRILTASSVARTPTDDQQCNTRQQPEQATRNELPFVSIVIAAYREERVITQRLNNLALQDYPADRFEVIIGVDGDEDLTGELVRVFGDPRVRLLQFPERRGKASVLNDCIPIAKGDIVVLSDANTMMEATAIRRLVRHFVDPQIGGVCGQLLLTDSASGENVDGIYWRYENFLKKCEGELGVLLGANGAIYAIRKELYEPIPSETIIDDFLIGMRVHLHGKKLIFDAEAVAREETAPHMQAEFHRRARIGAGGFQSLAWLTPLLNPARGLIALAFWSHKVLRWMAPSLLIAAILTNVVLASNPFYLHVLLVHETFYLLATCGLWLLHARRWPKLLRLPAMFVSMNAALLVGLWRFSCNRQKATWKRTERSEELKSDGQSGGHQEMEVAR